MNPFLPGDKSVSHRAILLAALADGVCEISGLNQGRDVQSSLDCIERLGANIIFHSGVHRIQPPTTSRLSPNLVLNCGNSGTTMRLLCGVLAHFEGRATLVGDESLQRRPMQRICEPLRRFQCHLHATHEGTSPLSFDSSGKRGHENFEYELPVASAQIKSALLLAGLNRNAYTVLHEPSQSRGHTENCLRWLGVRVESTPGRTQLFPSKLPLPAFKIQIPKDPSAAFHLLVPALLGSRLTTRVEMDSICSDPGRMGALRLLEHTADNIELLKPRRSGPETVVDLQACASPRLSKTFNLTPEDIPGLIDEIPALAVIASRIPGASRFSGIRELRYKESDRIALLEHNLRAFGVKVETGSDFMHIEGTSRLTAPSTPLSSGGDHRIAMAIGCLHAYVTGKSDLLAEDCIEVSYPGFVHELRQIYPWLLN